MLEPSGATVRLFLHVLASAVWVGGQLTFAAMRPTLGAAGPDLLGRVARQYNRVAWPAFAVLVITGVWSLTVIDLGSTSTDRQVTVFFHLLLAALSGVLAALHAGATTRLVVATSGAFGGLVAIAALFVGVLLRSG